MMNIPRLKKESDQSTQIAKVSFDFDGTLSNPQVQEYLQSLKRNYKIDVWVVTSRYDENHKHKYPANPRLDDLWEVTQKMGIEHHKVRFTCMEPKCNYLDGTSFLWHLDDDHIEIENAKSMGLQVPIINVKEIDWQIKCETIILEHFREQKIIKRGTLCYNEKLSILGVAYEANDGVAESWEEWLPLHPKNVSVLQLYSDKKLEDRQGEEVEFMIKYFWDPYCQMAPGPYAALYMPISKVE